MNDLTLDMDEANSSHPDSWDYPTPTPVYSNEPHDLDTYSNTNEYFLKKIVGTKEYPRRVITGMHRTLGKFIQIDSKNNCCQTCHQRKLIKINIIIIMKGKI